jgi:hypothetical protein
MPLTTFGSKIEKKFENKYGKTRGKQIFYKWENKQRAMHTPIGSKLILTGNKSKMRRMYTHLRKEHPSVRGHIKLY